MVITYRGAGVPERSAARGILEQCVQVGIGVRLARDLEVAVADQVEEDHRFDLLQRRCGLPVLLCVAHVLAAAAQAVLEEVAVAAGLLAVEESDGDRGAGQRPGKGARQLEYDRNAAGAVVGSEDPRFVLGVVVGAHHDVPRLLSGNGANDVPVRGLDPDPLDLRPPQLPGEQAALPAVGPRADGARPERDLGAQVAESAVGVKGTTRSDGGGWLVIGAGGDRNRSARKKGRKQEPPHSDKPSPAHALYVSHMAQGHMDRLTSIDASFLSNESGSSHMHIGATIICEGPPPSYEDLLAHIESRLHLVPRYRQKLAVPPAETGRPFWVDDAGFNLAYHVRHSALPAPGSEAQLRQLVGRVFSQQLDRGKPLWELWLVQGLKRKRFALISKTHHAVVDGVSGVDIATVLFDVKAQTEPVGAPKKWKPQPEPTGSELAARGVDGLARTPLRLARRLESALRHPTRALGEAREAVEGVGDVALALANRAPEVPLNTKIGSHRRYLWVRSDLDDLKTIKRALGGTVNDVVLAVVAGSLRHWLHSRRVDTDGLELRALVPVSIRGPDHSGELGNQIAAVRGPLPVFVEDPVERLGVVRQEMTEVKHSKQAIGAEVISRFNDFAPPTLLAQAARLNFSTRLFNLIVTNVPGPQIPLYVLGRRLEDVFPIAFLPPDHALAIAIMSYNGGINFGLLADYDSMEDVDAIAAGIKQEIAELLRAAREVESMQTEADDTNANEKEEAPKAS